VLSSGTAFPDTLKRSVIPNEAHFLLDDCYSKLSTPHTSLLCAYFLPLEITLYTIDIRKMFPFRLCATIVLWCERLCSVLRNHLLQVHVKLQTKDKDQHIAKAFQ